MSKTAHFYSGDIPQNYELEDVDGLCSFRDAFMYPVVIFELPPGKVQEDQLARPNSFTMKAQTVLTSSHIARLSKPMSTAGGQQEKKRRNSARFFIVPDTITVLRTLSIVLESIRPERIERQKKYFAAEAKKSGLPDAETGEVISEAALAEQTVIAFRKWARRYEIPEGDEGVLLSVLGSISNIAQASWDTLSATPIDDLTRDVILAFFGKEQPPTRDLKNTDFHNSCLSPQNENVMANDTASYSLNERDYSMQREQNTLFEPPPSQRGDQTDIGRIGFANGMEDHYNAYQYQHGIQSQQSGNNLGVDSSHTYPRDQVIESGMYEGNAPPFAPAHQTFYSNNEQNEDRDFFTPMQPLRNGNMSRDIRDSGGLLYHRDQHGQSALPFQNNNQYFAEQNHHQQQYGRNNDDQLQYGLRQHQYTAGQYNAKQRNKLVGNQDFSPFPNQRGFFR
uniref:Uncharacterized protein n=1 Tax=Leptocylindrus danicus TaxID=163516 RepID=A0A6U2M2T7_9STRA